MHFWVTEEDIKEGNDLAGSSPVCRAIRRGVGHNRVWCGERWCNISGQRYTFPAEVLAFNREVSHGRKDQLLPMEFELNDSDMRD